MEEIDGSLAFLLLKEPLDKGGEVSFASDTPADRTVVLDQQNLARQLRLCSEVLIRLTNTATESELARIRGIVSRMQQEIKDLTEHP